MVQGLVVEFKVVHLVATMLLATQARPDRCPDRHQSLTPRTDPRRTARQRRLRPSTYRPSGDWGRQFGYVVLAGGLDGLVPLGNDAAQVVHVLHAVAKAVLVVLLYLLGVNLVRVVLVPDMKPDGVERHRVKGAGNRAAVGEGDGLYVAVDVLTVGQRCRTQWA